MPTTPGFVQEMILLKSLTWRYNWSKSGTLSCARPAILLVDVDERWSTQCSNQEHSFPETVVWLHSQQSTDLKNWLLKKQTHHVPQRNSQLLWAPARSAALLSDPQRCSVRVLELLEQAAPHASIPLTFDTAGGEGQGCHRFVHWQQRSESLAFLH
jgi:hypothetical protein